MTPINALPPTSPNFAVLKMHAHLQVAAGKVIPPTAAADVSKFV